MFLMQWQVHTLSHSWKQYLHSYNIFMLTNNNHFDLLLIRGIQIKLILKRFNKREYKKKKTAVLKRNDKNRDIQREIETIYSSKTYKAIKDYLEEGKYPDEVLSIIPYEARKQRKRGFRQIIDKDKRYKLMPSKVNRNSNDLLRNWNWRQEKIQKKEKTIKKCIFK